MSKIHNVLLEMLSDRKYDISNVDANNFDFLVSDIYNKTLKVIKTSETKIGINIIKQFDNEFANIDSILIIYYGTITTFAKQYINTINKHFEFFLESELSRNITKHSLVPKHYVLSHNEKQIFLKESKLQSHNLPRCSYRSYFKIFWL